MHLQHKLKILKELDHAGHNTALALIAAAAVAEVLHGVMPRAVEWERIFSDVLHWVHYLALGVALLYVPAHTLLKRNVGKELAAGLDSSFSESPMPRRHLPRLASRLPLLADATASSAFLWLKTMFCSPFEDARSPVAPLATGPSAPATAISA